ncbi:glycosyl transferase [Chryseobacterium formosense]|uniref:Glycosyl transferase n=1 Tax=Chryseobacterium formosense TaxID=236814 RepID=A0A085Z1Y2_9FLAO|nr:exopolysaccharide biosynthesis polyprenyl glycosylphosphotransferase [Chryseobacterium formosense]KFE98445.1 glycosyl transferase [Chryseobacterium formosense]SFT87886.1 putative colanic acid biosysnthesis UDP-glucose lipid carrier transferase [Chryseobacterium formosense]
MQRIRYSRYLKSIIILLDLLVIAGVFIFYFISTTRGVIVQDEDLWYENSFPLLLVIFFWILLSGRTKIYNISRNLTYILFVERIIVHFLLFIIGLVLIRKVSSNQFFGSELTWLSLYLFFFIFLLKSAVYYLIRYIRTIGINHRNVMFLSENNSTEVLKRIIEERKDFGYKTYDYTSEVNAENLTEFWKKNGINTLFLPAENSFSDEKQNEIFRLAEANKVHISLIPNISRNNFFFYDLGYIQTQPVLTQAKYPLDYYSNFLLKRTFDIIFSVLVLLFICSWLFPIIALLIKKSSKGPVFFIQKRYGFHEEVFNCIKFRTMFVNDDSAKKTTSENDARITKIGKFLRKTSLDEMPQFINVLKGEMSVVGPRPHMLAVDDYYKPKIGRYSLRSHTNPGITGLAQVNGLRGDAGDVEIEMNKRILADAFYVRNWSFVLDLVIILRTILLVIKGDKNAN